MKMVWEKAIRLILVAIIALPTGSGLLRAQTPQIEWIRQFGTSGPDYALAIDAVGDIYVTGRVAIDGHDLLLRKYDAEGNEIWTQQLGTTSVDWAYAIAVNNSGLYVAGTTSGAFPGQNNIGLSDAYLAKFDLDGNLIWIRQFGTSSADYARDICVKPSEIYVAGVFGNDCYLRKYDDDGNVVWSQQFGTSSLNQAWHVFSDASGVYMGGLTTGTLPGQIRFGGYTDAFIRKYDADGNELWTRQFGTSADDCARGICGDDSGIYVTGQLGYNSFLRKLDAEGNDIWTTTIIGPQAATYAWDADFFNSAIYVAGQVNGALPGQTRIGNDDGFVCAYDVNGSMLWAIQFGTAAADRISSVSAASNGVYVAGNTQGTMPGQTSSGGDDAFVAKIEFNAHPIANAGPDQSLTIGETAIFDGAGSSDPDGVIESYEWVFGDGGTATGALVNHVYTAKGTYAVTLTVTDDRGATATDTLIVSVTNTPPVADAGPDQTFPANSPAGRIVTLDGSRSLDPDGDALSFVWKDASGAIVGSSVDCALTVSVGTHVFWLTVSDGRGGTASDSVTIIVNRVFVLNGFYSPIDNTPVVNSAKSGSTVPVRWRVTDLAGAPISDPSSFLSLTSYSVTCGQFSNDPIDEIEAYSAGTSGLQYLGDGYWQFNWKTLKSYAGGCRVMILTLSDGSAQSAYFNFK
jgi:PKD repeat protein